MLDYLVIYNSSNQSFDLLGEVAWDKMAELRKKLETAKADPELIYQLLHKDYADRFIALQMQKFDQGESVVGDLGNGKLTEAEAFYIVTGIEGETYIEENFRNANNLGSIFITEVDRCEEKTITIHIYELVRNSEEDVHTSTIDWLEIDRATGKVTSLFEDLYKR